MRKEKYETLARSPVFRGIRADEIEKLLHGVPHRVANYKKGSMIVFRGDRCEKLMILVSGSVRGEMVDANGRAVQVETIPAPRPLAPAFIFGKKNLFPVDVTAEEPVEILMIPKTSLLKLFQMNAVMLNNYLDLISSRTHFLSERLWFMSFKTIKEKYAQYLLNLLKPGEKEVLLPKNQQELSEFFGVSRPSLARVVREMQDTGVIEQHRRHVMVKNLGGLQEMAERSE